MFKGFFFLFVGDKYLPLTGLGLYFLFQEHSALDYYLHVNIWNNIPLQNSWVSLFLH